MNALIITGPVGVGKSSTATRVSEILAGRNVPNAVYDLDYVSVRPWSEVDPFYMNLSFKNIASTWQNFEQAGIHYLIFPNVIENRRHVDAIRFAIPNSNLTVVRLTAPVELIRDRLKARETGESLEWHLNRAIQLTNALDKEQVEDLVVNTEQKSIHEVAAEILSLVGW